MTDADTSSSPDEVLADLINQARQAADRARREHLQWCLALAAHRIHERFPNASRIAADFSHAISDISRGSRVSLVSVHDGCTVWHREADVPSIGLPRQVREQIENTLTDALCFDVCDRVLDEVGWTRRPFDFYIRDIDLPRCAPAS
ncbi:hypothetical protein OG339_47950 (plasmid) [Streptosporangium sp. NBC_01495]|uniref:hypothetical protein n=1 Tax=Streptosporangium sp. NBC_01495 TaxID=2903899 RepID=UPI002E36615C|nr:hypothetical protein [Streptosporangium sp. NBC_01495]